MIGFAFVCLHCGVAWSADCALVALVTVAFSEWAYGVPVQKGRGRR